jgi:phosphomannomutase
VLLAARETGLSLAGLFARLPRRFSRAALLTRFPRALGLGMVRRFSPADERIREAVFSAAGILLLDEDRNELPVSTAQAREMEAVRQALEQFFRADLGFGRITRLNHIDGVRAVFSNGDVAHVRPSGNADELRIYAVADTQERADAIAGMGVAEPGGILRRMERAVARGEDRHA